MYVEERHQDIINTLKKQKKASVTELSERYSVTTATIRSDLKILHNQGVIHKTHGGAVLKEGLTNYQGAFEISSDKRKSINESSKSEIGRLAASLVLDSETILIDTGTTTLHLAEQLKDKKNLTVITNDMEIARILEGLPSVELILLGGIVKKNYHCTYQLGLSLLDHLNVDKAFMGTNSFSLTSGASVADIKLADTKRKMVERANQTVLLCDTSKLNKQSLAQFVTCEDIDYLVTDHKPDDYQAYFQEEIELLYPG